MVVVSNAVAMSKKKKKCLCLSSQSYYFIRPEERRAALRLFFIYFFRQTAAEESHGGAVYTVIGAQSARVMIRRINQITIIIIILSDELAVLTNAPRGRARGRAWERERFCWSEQIEMTLSIRRRAHVGQGRRKK